MKAIYKGKLYSIWDDQGRGVDLIDDVEDGGEGNVLSVSYGDPDLIIDPTDDEINNILPDYL